MGTIQLDSQMPQRFDLTYMGADNAEHTPYVIHRALLGSLERFIGILTEHYGGAFPFWLSPVQVRVLPVGEDTARPRRALAAKLADYRVEVDASDETVGKRIRNAELDKIPFVVVYGDKESDESLAIREHGGGQSTRSLAELRADRLLGCHSLASRGETVSHLPADGLGGSTEWVENGVRRCLPAVFSFSKEDDTSLVTCDLRPRRGSWEPPRRPEPQTRINDAIRVPRVRLIGEEGQQLGIKTDGRGTRRTRTARASISSRSQPRPIRRLPGDGLREVPLRARAEGEGTRGRTRPRSTSRRSSSGPRSEFTTTRPRKAMSSASCTSGRRSRSRSCSGAASASIRIVAVIS